MYIRACVEVFEVFNLTHQSPVYDTEKLPRVNPGSTWVELTHVDFCSVNTHLPGLNPGKLNPFMEVGSTLMEVG